MTAILTSHSNTSGSIPCDGLPRDSASRHGVDPDRVIAFIEDVEAAGLDLHGLLLQRNGRVLAEGWKWPYSSERPRILHSVAKSFTACAIGFLVDEGLLDLSDKVVSFFPDELPGQYDPKLPKMTVEHLLTMRTGHQSNTSGSVWRQIQTSWITEFFRIPLLHEPGKQYVYTSAASYMLSAIVSKISGQTMHSYLRPRLFKPLGITEDAWDIGPDGINPGGNGLTAPPSAMLKLGMLHSQGGIWNGRRILSEAWVTAATSPQGSVDSAYGYHWAMKPRHAYCAVGVFMQMSIVFPEHAATLTLVGAMKNSAQIIPYIERHFPTAFSDAISLSEDADQRLGERLQRMRQVPGLVSQGTSPFPITTACGFEVAPNDLGVSRLRFTFEQGTLRFELHDAAGPHFIVVGIDRWYHGTTDMPGEDLHHGYAMENAEVIAGARWINDTTLEMEWIYVGSAFRDCVLCEFVADTVRVLRKTNVNSGQLEHPVLTGKCLPRRVIY